MSKRVSTILVRASTLSLALSGPSCSNNKGEELSPCPRRDPTFLVQITTSHDVVPRDAKVRVFYGGSNMESFNIEDGNGDNEDVCCTTGPTTSMLDGVLCEPDVTPSARDARAPLEREPHATALRCELNTNGAARIEVEARGYPLLERTLEAQRSDDEELEHCDALVTKEVFLVLTRGDAGP